MHTLTSQAIEEESDLQFVIQSITKFSSILKPNDELLIYLRFDESLTENSHHAQLLEKAIQSFPKVKMSRKCGTPNFPPCCFKPLL